MASVDKQAVAAAFGRAASSYQQHDELQRLSAAQLLSQLPARAFPRVLDAGCGPGSYSRYWREQGLRGFIDPYDRFRAATRTAGCGPACPVV